MKDKQLIPKIKVKLKESQLKDMFDKQLKFQKRFYELPLPIKQATSYERLMLTCIIAEAIEALNWLNWKPWKKTKEEFNRYEFLNELIDIQHFLINAALGVGCTEQEFYKLFLNKHAENINRQERGY